MYDSEKVSVACGGGAFSRRKAKRRRQRCCLAVARPGNGNKCEMLDSVEGEVPEESGVTYTFHFPNMFTRKIWHAMSSGG